MNYDDSVCESNKCVCVCVCQCVQIVVGEDSSAKPKAFSVPGALEATTDSGGSLTLPRQLTPVEYKLTVVTNNSPYDAGFDGQVRRSFLYPRS